MTTHFDIRLSLALLLCSLLACGCATNGRTANLFSTSDPGAAPGGVYDVRAFGAVGDGKTLDTPAVDRAITAAYEAGGGTVRFGAGNYLSVTIHLKSNVSLYFDQGATLIAADPKQGFKYDDPEPCSVDKYQDFGHSHFRNSLIYGENLENVSILGPGMIWGKGLVRSGGGSRTKEQNDALREESRKRREEQRKQDAENANSPDNDGDGEPDATTRPANPERPFGYPSKGDAVENGWANKSIALKLCRNVIIRDVSLKHGGHFAILATGVDNLTIDNLKIDTNRDGMDIDACRNVRVSNCSVNSPFDDGICLKSSFALGFNRACENITITNCQVSGYDEGSFLDGTFTRGKRRGGQAGMDDQPTTTEAELSPTTVEAKDAPTKDATKDGATTGPTSRQSRRREPNPTGRIKFGTESNGGFKNVTISNCVFDFCRGLALETVDGGLLEDVTITNITMRDIVNAPIFLRLGARVRGPEGTKPGELRRVMISNLVCYNADHRYGSIISGIPGHDIEDVRLQNIRIYYKGGGTKKLATSRPAEKEKTYPEPAMFGQIPAYGFFVRHVKGLYVRDVEVSYDKEEFRSPFVLEDVKGAIFDSVRAAREEGVPMFLLRKVSDFVTRDCQGVPDTKRDSADDEKL